MGQYRFISCNSGGDVDAGEVVHVWGYRVNGKSLYLPLSFAVNLKLLLKKIRSTNKKRIIGCGNKEVKVDPRKAVSIECRI